MDEGTIIDPVVIEKIKQFQQHDFKHKQFTTKEEINMINRILDDVVNYIENKKAATK